jgi:hypothetical protein
MQYPKHRREGKDKAAEAYPRAVERIVANHPGLDYDQARAYLRQKTIEYAASPAGNNGVFTPLPASWLNAGRFEDEAESWTRKESPNGKHERTIGPGQRFDPAAAADPNVGKW